MSLKKNLIILAKTANNSIKNEAYKKQLSLIEEKDSDYWRLSETSKTFQVYIDLARACKKEFTETKQFSYHAENFLKFFCDYGRMEILTRISQKAKIQILKGVQLQNEEKPEDFIKRVNLWIVEECKAIIDDHNGEVPHLVPHYQELRADSIVCYKTDIIKALESFDENDGEVLFPVKKWRVLPRVKGDTFIEGETVELVKIQYDTDTPEDIEKSFTTVENLYLISEPQNEFSDLSDLDLDGDDEEDFIDDEEVDNNELNNLDI